MSSVAEHGGVYEIAVPDYESEETRVFVGGSEKTPADFERDVAALRTGAIEEALEIARREDDSVRWSVVLELIAGGLVARGWKMVQPHREKIGFGSHVPCEAEDLNVPDDLRVRLRAWHEERKTIQRHEHLLEWAGDLEARGELEHAQAADVRRAVADSKKARERG